MRSTFFGLTISYSGLNVSQAQINTTANNISNVNTKGYSKQVVNTVASCALRAHQKYGTVGTGVTAESVTQNRDLYYDEKYWNNQSEYGFYDKKLYFMNQVEGYFSNTNSSTGFSSIYAKMFNTLSTLQGSAGDETIRKEFVSNAKNLTEYFNSTNTKLSELQSSINDEIKTTVDQINSIAQKIAILNKQINVIEQQKSYANELRDQRALLIDELSQIVVVDVKETEVRNSNYPDMYTGATYYTVKINGQKLVDTYEFETLECKSRDTNQRYNQSDIDGLYDIVWAKDGMKFDPVTATSSGTLKAMFEMRDGNNEENLKGTVKDATARTLTIEYPSIKEVNELNLPITGTLWCNSTKYSYDSFEYKLDNDGNITSIMFNLSEETPVNDVIGIMNKKLTVGADINYMGIPYYQNQMNLFLRNFCEAFNDIQRSGVDAYGEPMESFFVAKNPVDDEQFTMYSEPDPVTGRYTGSSDSYYLLTAANVQIADRTDRNPRYFSTTTAANYSSGQDAADIIVQLQQLESRTEIFRGGGADTFLQCIYADMTVDTQECKIFTSNYENIQKSIQQQRMSVSGVDEDEEALDLIKFQNAYNLSSKCISVFTEIYDRLILNTGV
ncbi:MAG: flagellar hook-associated protein FlgK [Pseudobutyrivibrio sp.]|nr:flagellar hook-associated protein FlgK [Pseudobutyrivibrio sp.]